MATVAHLLVILWDFLLVCADFVMLFLLLLDSRCSRMAIGVLTMLRRANVLCYSNTVVELSSSS
eukprot:2062221-Pyramimonas_sp.AAC.1